MWTSIVEKSNQVILDKQEEIQLCLTCLLARGHLLIEDVPGVGKTTLVQTVARLLGLESTRIQFTSDLLPADIIGNSIFDADKKSFHFFQGPLFSHLVLADELNRANPRTQSALLQAMEEGQVTVDRHTYSLPNPFFLIATQNPRFQMGTFPLPESQLDRFLLSVQLNFASTESEIKIFQGVDPRAALQKLEPLIARHELMAALENVDKVHVSEMLARYISHILQYSRTQSDRFVSLSTRTGLALVRASKAWAVLQGRDYVMPEDVQKIAIAVLGHRLGGQEGVEYGRSRAKELMAFIEVPT